MYRVLRDVAQKQQVKTYNVTSVQHEASGRKPYQLMR